MIIKAVNRNLHDSKIGLYYYQNKTLDNINCVNEIEENQC